MGNYTYVQLRKRTQYLRGETDYSTSSVNTVINDHILFAIRDTIAAYPFNWDRTTTTGTITTLSSGNYGFALPANFFVKWNLDDARILNAGTTDSIFRQIPIEDRNSFTSPFNYVYWITYNTTTSLYEFNTLTTSGTVTYTYHFIPADLSADADICIVPDGEAVALLAAAKMWIGDERNAQLKSVYEQDAAARIKAMYSADLTFGPLYTEGNPVDMNRQLLGDAAFPNII